MLNAKRVGIDQVYLDRQLMQKKVCMSTILASMIIYLVDSSFTMDFDESSLRCL